MAKKGKKAATDAATDFNTTLQFRPGESLGRRVAQVADQWGVSWNEATRRLVTLAACSLTPAYSPAVERLGDYLGGVNEYFQAADRVRVALHSSDTTRMAM